TSSAHTNTKGASRSGLPIRIVARRGNSDAPAQWPPHALVILFDSAFPRQRSKSPREKRAEGSADALDRKKLAAFSALGGGCLRFPIGDRRCNRTRASVGNAGGTARSSLTNATLAASRLLHRRSPTASQKGQRRRARPKKVGRIFGPRRW